MRFKVLALCAGFGAFAAAPALADCVDYSKTRHQAAAAQLKKAPPTAAELGVPNLDGLTLDTMASTGDPKCDGASPKKRFVYTSQKTSAQVLETIYPYLAGARSKDGMNREWWAQPMSGRGELSLTSGAVVQIPQSHTATNVRVVINKPATLAALTTNTQPYSIKDILDGSPWPGGGDGPRQFVRSDGGESGYAAPNNNALKKAGNASSGASSAASTPTQSQTACAPKPTDSAAGSNAGRAVGAEVGGAVLGGGYGRNVGAAAGSILGGLGKKKPKDPPAQSTLPPCP